VLKFSHKDPNIFTTSSYDRTIRLWDVRDVTNPIFTLESKNPCVLVCWSPDDKYLLSSGIDNDIVQWNVHNASINQKYDVRPQKLRRNYTRAYYMNRGEYIIVGSCEQDNISIINSTTGKFLRDIDFGEMYYDQYIYCQSLRGDPFYDFNFSALIAKKDGQKIKMDIVKCNLLK